MKKERFTTDYTLFESIDELSENDKELVSAAEAASQKSYSPYSNFKVGAAIRTKSGTIIQGSRWVRHRMIGLLLAILRHWGLFLRICYLLRHKREVWEPKVY